MTYLRSLFLNFLIVFFVNHSFPGIEVQDYEFVPNIGADILFSFIIGLLNSLIVPGLIVFSRQLKIFPIAIIAAVISFGGYIVLAIYPMEVAIVRPIGIIVGGFAVWAMSFFTNYFELKHLYKENK